MRNMARMSNCCRRRKERPRRGIRQKSLEGTTISDEVILFSELSFGPYAVVVDFDPLPGQGDPEALTTAIWPTFTEFQAMRQP